MSRPINLPSELPSRLMRTATGKCTPMSERFLSSENERARARELKAMQEALEEQGKSREAAALAANNSNNGSGIGAGSSKRQHQTDPTVRRRGVYVHDQRSHWIDSNHRGERRNLSVERSGVAGDLEYDPSQDRYVDSVQRQIANRTGAYTDAERIALRSLAATPQPRPEHFHSSALRQRSLGVVGDAAASPPRSSSSLGFSASSSSFQPPPQKPFAEIYHERLRKVEQAAAASPLPPLATTSNSMRAHIADATANFFGQRHAPGATQAAVQAPRSSAATVLHGEAKNAAGHHPLHPTVVAQPQQQLLQCNYGDDQHRKKTRAVVWKQQRFDRDDFIHERREIVAAKREAVENTKHQRAVNRSVGPYDRDADSFLRREKGPRICRESPVRSTTSTMANWLFAYPVKGEQAQK